VKNSVTGFVAADESRTERRARRSQGRQLLAATDAEVRPRLPAFPSPDLPKAGARVPDNWRGPVSVRPPAHRASTRVLQAAYPFLAGTGAPMRGAVIGEDVFTRRPYALDPWEAYRVGDVRSFSVAVIGTLGSGKSLFCKVWANRLLSMGRKIAVPNDPKGEWTWLCQRVSGSTIAVGPGTGTVINPLDAGPARPDLDSASHEALILQQRRAVLLGILSILRGHVPLAAVEHTALDVALEAVLNRVESPTLGDVLRELETPSETARELVGDSGRDLFHTMRRLVRGDMAGMFDGQSTVRFDDAAPMVSVDTSRLRSASPEARAIMTLITSTWIKQAISVPGRGKRVIIHEEAAIGLLADVTASGSGLNDKTEAEKLGRHDDVSNWYLFHRISDLDQLGDKGSAVREQALGLIADADMRIVFGLKSDTAPKVAEVLGMNETLTRLTLDFEPGEGLFLVGQKRVAVVRVQPTAAEFAAFKTDTVERSNS